MKRKVGIIKRIFALLLVFLLSINSFAAVVSDNDGSAFITKAEFDSLKNNFQSQIDSYNQSIDSKIDGAIASYLSGIKLEEGKNAYKIYGHESASLYQGQHVNDFRLSSFYTDTFNWTATTATHPGYGIILKDVNKTNFGYGAGWWCRGYYWAANDPIFESDSMGLCMPSEYNIKQNKWAVSTERPEDHPIGSGYRWHDTSFQLTAPAKPEEIYNYKLTEKFGVPISIIDPYFPLFDIVETTGSVPSFNIKFAYIINGYSEDLGSHGGRDGNFNLMRNDNTQIIIRLEHPNGSTEDLIDLKTKAEKTWINVNVDNLIVGDRIGMKVIAKGSPDGANYYSLFYYTREVPGWEIVT